MRASAWMGLIVGVGALAGAVACGSVLGEKDLFEGTTDDASPDGAPANPTDDAAPDGGSDAGDDGSSFSPGRVVMFGGQGDGSTSYIDDTWTFDGRSWSPATAGTAPPLRGLAAFGTWSGVPTLFGGYGTGFLGDTWTFDGAAWTYHDVTGPSSRDSAGAASLNGQLVLFGGLNGMGFADTWSWDGSAWNASSAAGPSKRWGYGMASLNGQVVLFGGKNGSDTSPRLADTWTFNGSRWTQLTPSPSPPGRSYSMMARLGNRVVLFGGTGDDGQLGDTWEFDGAAWTQTPVAGPSARHAPAASAIGSASDRIVLFGGGDATPEEALADTWIYDGATWREVPASGAQPPARGYAAMTDLP